MLLANRSVAELLSEAGFPTLYRIHPQPDSDQWARMADDLRDLGLHARMDSRADINALCRKVAGTPMEYAANLAVLRNFKRALYSDHLDEHFGLAFEKYLHFTSPIRRYPDLLVHRVLLAYQKGVPPPYARDDLARIARHCSDKERSADAAESESLNTKRLEYYARRLAAGETGPWKGAVVAAIPKGLLVEIVETLQRGLIPHYTLPGGLRMPRRGRARGRAHEGGMPVGSTLDVELVRVDTERRLVDFRIAGPPETRPRRRAPRRTARPD